MKTDWNGDGKHDWTDDYMDYKLSSSNNAPQSSNDSPNTRGNAGSFRIPTWLLVIVVLGIISGDLPITGFTVVLAVIIAFVIWIRMIS